MTSAGKKALLGATLIGYSMAICAAGITGRLDDPSNPLLVGSDLGAPGFADTATIANNVALYAFTLTASGMVTIQSTGFAAGGVDPYFSLFAGSGNAATFVDSNYAQAFSTGDDFLWSATLAAGAYQLALGAFANLSLAENVGSGSTNFGTFFPSRTVCGTCVFAKAPPARKAASAATSGMSFVDFIGLVMVTPSLRTGQRSAARRANADPRQKRQLRTDPFRTSFPGADERREGKAFPLRVKAPVGVAMYCATRARPRAAAVMPGSIDADHRGDAPEWIAARRARTYDQSAPPASAHALRAPAVAAPVRGPRSPA